MNLSPLMPDENKNIGGSLGLDFRESSFNMTRGDEDIEGGSQNF